MVKIKTDTQDMSGKVTSHKDVNVTEDEVREAVMSFIGEYNQIPPMYSALKVNGKKLYELAREGKEVERKARPVTISKIKILQVNLEEQIFSMEVTCSKGTYIRTLCHDIGAALGVGGCLSSLRRIRAGIFSIDACVTMEEIQTAREQETHMALLRPVDSLFSQYPALYLGEKETLRCKNGAENAIPGMPDGSYRVYGPGNEFLMLGQCQSGVLRTVKSFFEVKEG